MVKKDTNEWDIVISSKRKFFNILLFSDLIKYKDLIFMFIKRDFITFYKQTILGPLWYVIQPLVNTIVFTIIFGNLAKLPTDGMPPFIFYMAGNVCWSYFAVCIQATSNTFVKHEGIFGKVYFPRLTVPISHIIISLLQFAIQFSIFIFFLIYFIYSGSSISLDFKVLLLPLILLHSALLSLGCGMIISSLTAKYRDLTFAMTFFVQLWMYASPIVYPLSLIPEKYQMLAAFNPMTAIVESFKLCFLGESSIQFVHIQISLGMTVFLFILGLILFNKVEKNFMDTV